MIERVTFIAPDGEAPTPDVVALALRDLAAAAVGRRSIAVVGGLTVPDGGDAVGEHDRIGRLAVRLGIGLFVAVGPGARHLQAGAALEGSWNGESVIVADEHAAYDLLHEQLRSDDVVLVTPPLTGLVARLRESLG